MIWLISIALLLLAVCILWRYLTRRYCIPWPYWLAWWLENPYMILFCNPKWLLQSYQITPGMRILEIGCGAGRVSEAIFQAMGSKGALFLLDLQESMLRLARKRLSPYERADLITFVRANLVNQELPAKDLDRIIVVTVLGEIPDHGAVIKKIKNSLRSGGKLFITEVIPDPCYLSSRYLRRLVESYDFRFDSISHNLVAYTMSFTKP